MDKSSLVQKVEQNLNKELRDILLSVMENADIPMKADGEQENFITIYVSLDTSHNCKKNKRPKNYQPKLIIQYSERLNFDIKAVARNTEQPLNDVSFIWTILKAQCAEIALRKIKAYSKELFYNASRLYNRDYKLQLLMLPFEVNLEDTNTVYISKLPEFNDLWFSSSPNFTEKIDNKSFIEAQANSIEEMAKKLEAAQQ